MGVLTLKNVETWINESTGVFTNGKVKTITINYEAAEQETTAFTTSTGIKPQTYIAGLVNWTADLECYQDYDSGQVDATLFPLIGASDFAVRFAVSSTGVDANNPQWTGHSILTSYNPINGSPGDVAMAPITLRGTGLLVRNTASCSGW
jgi:hypothetical protein